MKASETSLLAFLGGKKQFSIPIYQRTYSWTQQQCSQLWDDVTQAGNDASIQGHFIGSIVYIQEGIYSVTEIPQLLVIDGQQRLTTLTLLVTALRNALPKEVADAELSREQLDEEYLFNKYGKNDLHYKLLLTQSDRDTLIRLIEGREPPTSGSTRLLDNYKFFEEQIRSKGAPSLATLYQGMGKLMVVDISLNRQYDNPQLIFESLNSTGLALSQADLIRNYVLMGLQPETQIDLYKRYWYPMEVSFGHAEYTNQFNRFMRDYLTVKSRSGTIPNINDVYAQFKSFVHGQPGGDGMESIVKGVHS